MRSSTRTVAVVFCSLAWGCTPSAPAGPSQNLPRGTGGTSTSIGSGGGSGGSASQGQGGSSSTGAGGSSSGSGGESRPAGTGGTPASGGSGAGGSGTGGSGSGGAGATGGAPGDGKDAAPNDAPAATGGPGCVGVTGKFCDDFEKQTEGMIPAGEFAVRAPAGTLLVDSSKPYSGTKSVHIKVATPGTTARMTFTKQFPLATNDLHGRLMVYYAKVPSANSIHWDLVASRNPTNEWAIGSMFNTFIYVCDPPDHGISSKTVVTPNKWMCLQWEFKYAGAGADNTFVAKIDGVVADKGMFTGAASNGEKWAAGPWRDLNIGWVSYGTKAADVEMWIDDVAWGEQAIPCPAAPAAP